MVIIHKLLKFPQVSLNRLHLVRYPDDGPELTNCALLTETTQNIFVSTPAITFPQGLNPQLAKPGVVSDACMEQLRRIYNHGQALLRADWGDRRLDGLLNLQFEMKRSADLYNEDGKCLTMAERDEILSGPFTARALLDISRVRVTPDTIVWYPRVMHLRLAPPVVDDMNLDWD